MAPARARRRASSTRSAHRSRPGTSAARDEIGRVIRSLTFLRAHAGDNPWAHPVEGLIVHIDLTGRAVLRVEDDGDVPVPTLERLRARDGRARARRRSSRSRSRSREGPSFSVDGSEVTWEDWRLRVGFNAREGLILHQLCGWRGPRRCCTGRRARDGGALRRHVAPPGSGSATSTPASTCSARTPTTCARLRLPRRDPLLPRVGRRRPRRAGRDPAGDLPARGGRRHPLEAHRPRRAAARCAAPAGWSSRRSPPSATTTTASSGTSTSTARSSSRPRRPASCSAAPAMPGQRAAARDRDRARPVRAGPPAPVLRAARRGGRRRAQQPARGRRRRRADGRTTRTATRSRGAARRCATEREAHAARPIRARGRVWEIRSADRVNRRRQADRVPARAARVGDADGPAGGDACTPARPSRPGTCGRRRSTPTSASPPVSYPNAHAGGAGLPAWTARRPRPRPTPTSCCGTCSGPTHVPRPEDWPIMPVDHSGFCSSPTASRPQPGARPARRRGGPVLPRDGCGARRGHGCCGGGECRCHH